MICKVKNTIERNSMLKGVSSVAVGLSGGADSMCLIDVLIKLKVQYDIIIKAVHVNHNIRGDEALRDENHVRAYCKEKGIELLCFSVDVPKLSKELSIGEEECGRIVRYECFEKAGCDVIATAHTLSDSVETVLFNLVRGTGSKGLSGISAKRSPDIIRPLIDCTREEIEVYCESENLSYVTDSTNLTDDYSRNFIRHKIIPSLSEINSDAVGAISKAADIIDEESSFIEECAMKLIADSETENGYKRELFEKAHSAVIKRAFRILLQEKMGKSVEYRHIILCEDAFINRKGKIEIGKDLYISLKGDIISFSESIDKTFWECSVKDKKAQTPYGEYELIKTDSAYGIDLSKIKGELKFTSRKDGDRIYLRKRKLTKSLRKLFNEMKIPEDKRNSLAVLRDGDKVVWVESAGIDGNYLSDEKKENNYIILKDGEKLW